MNKQIIKKYEIEFSKDIQEIVIPKSGKILKIKLNHRAHLIDIWALCDLQDQINKNFDLRRFKIFSDEEDVKGKYIDTVYINYYGYHLFEII